MSKSSQPTPKTTGRQWINEAIKVRVNALEDALDLGDDRGRRRRFENLPREERGEFAGNNSSNETRAARRPPNRSRSVKRDEEAAHASSVRAETPRSTANKDVDIRAQAAHAKRSRNDVLTEKVTAMRAQSGHKPSYETDPKPPGPNLGHAHAASPCSTLTPRASKRK